MKAIITLLFLPAVMISCQNQESKKEDKHQHDSVQKTDAPEKKPLSPHTETMAMIGDAHIHIDYSSPGVRDRIIFGGLLAYNQVWQAGAHMATWIETNKDLKIGGQTLAAGKYGFFTIPSMEQWTIIFNSHWDQHGKDEYNPDEDVLRFEIKPTWTDSITEHLNYTITKKGENKGAVTLAWEKVKVSFDFEVLN